MCTTVLQFKGQAKSGMCELRRDVQGDLGTRVGQVLIDARERVSNALEMLQSPHRWGEIKKDYSSYFVEALDFSKTYNYVLEVLVKTSCGLHSDVTLSVQDEVQGGHAFGNVAHVAANPVRKMSQADSNFLMLNIWKDQSERNRQLDKIRTTFNLSREVDESTTLVRSLDSNQLYRTGPIEIQKALFDWNSPDIHLNGGNPLATLIHEATHKYAGTIDYCYFDRRDGKTPLRPEGAYHSTRFGEAFSDKTGGELARMNADSYAMFCFWVGSPGVINK